MLPYLGTTTNKVCRYSESGMMCSGLTRDANDRTRRFPLLGRRKEVEEGGRGGRGGTEKREGEEVSGEDKVHPRHH